MIDSRDLIAPEKVEIILPLTDNSIMFINVKGWESQALKLEIPVFQALLKNTMRLLVSDELRLDKKVLKKTLNLNIQLKKNTESGVVYILWERNKGGRVYIGQAPNILELNDINFADVGWNKLNEILIISKNEIFPLSLRLSIEARVLKTVRENKFFSLLNNKKDVEEKINSSEFQFKDLNVRIFYLNVEKIFACLSVDLLK